ncbi:hypothetical protein GQ56_0106735 [Burkholderia paludis]|uniref:class I SAM-dependent methyltransferase n=1 Tax=Burkholderia paludis TaxID=1506587 RepID=UPI0004DB96CC|nr:class I SAM-dependent methyltransferase [Burkholderia paludis]KFG97974.1 hypothetical protein GQ56_0106735 [Burkholderia paludis]
MADFDTSATSYDQRIPTLVPGYALAQDVVRAIMLDLLPTDASILICGAGTGAELLRLGQAASRWRFTAVDPSAAMLGVARTKVQHTALANHVAWHPCRLEDAPPGQHDAAVSLLVGHFIPDDGARLDYLRAMAMRMKPGSPGLLFEYEATPLPDGAYRHWLIANGLNHEDAADVQARIDTHWHPVTAERRQALLKEAGYRSSETCFQALGFRVSLVRRHGAGGAA